MEDPISFSGKLKEAQDYYYSENWRKFKKTFDSEEGKKYLLKDFDLFENTAIHVAARSDSPSLLRHLLEKLLPQDRWNALRRRNYQGNTLLHEIALQEEVEMVDVVLEFEKTVAAPPPEEEDERRQPLLKLRNDEGETPLFRAAKCGHLKMVQKMAQRQRRDGDDDISHHFHSKDDNNILHVSIYHLCFDIAHWIMKQRDGNCLALEKNENGLTCFQLLSRMPHAFRSHHFENSDTSSSWGYHDRILYYLLPEEGYDGGQGDDISELCGQHRDLESGQNNYPNTPISGLSRICHAFWKCVATVSKRTKRLLDKKQQHKLAERLVELLVKMDTTWALKSETRKNAMRIKVPAVLLNVPDSRKRLDRKAMFELQVEVQERKNGAQVVDKGQANSTELEHSNYYKYTPLLVAASYGILEIVKILLKEHPAAIHHISHDGQNVLHMAVKHRKKEIFALLTEHPELPALASQISEYKSRTILHQVAITDYYRAPSLAGSAFQLQRELQWYKDVEGVIPHQLIMHCDGDNLTAGDLLDISHDDMLRDAQSWIKETAQSCSTVSILVATVVFAAAYTIPGGSEGGTPIFLRSRVFLFFTIMDIVALALSLASVMMFLSILTSPFELWDFHKSLPWKLKIGFVFLFGSLTTTMLAFIATILLTIKLQVHQWTSTLVYTAAFFPVTIFAFIVFPIYMKLPSLFTWTWKKVKNVTPIDRMVHYRRNI